MEGWQTGGDKKVWRQAAEKNLKEYSERIYVYPTSVTVGSVNIEITAYGDEDANGDVMEIAALIRNALKPYARQPN